MSSINDQAQSVSLRPCTEATSDIDLGAGDEEDNKGASEHTAEEEARENELMGAAQRARENMEKEAAKKVAEQKERFEKQIEEWRKKMASLEAAEEKAEEEAKENAENAAAKKVIEQKEMFEMKIEEREKKIAGLEVAKKKAEEEVKEAARKVAEQKEKFEKQVEEQKKKIGGFEAANEKAEEDIEKLRLIKFEDSVGRRFSFPWRLCKTWKVCGLISYTHALLVFIDLDADIHSGHEITYRPSFPSRWAH